MKLKINLTILDTHRVKLHIDQFYYMGKRQSSDKKNERRDNMCKADFVSRGQQQVIKINQISQSYGYLACSKTVFAVNIGENNWKNM